MPCPCDCLEFFDFPCGHYILCPGCVHLWYQKDRKTKYLTDGELPDSVQPILLGHGAHCSVCSADAISPWYGITDRRRSRGDVRGSSLHWDLEIKRWHSHQYAPTHLVAHCAKGHWWHACLLTGCWCGYAPACVREFVLDDTPQAISA